MSLPTHRHFAYGHLPDHLKQVSEPFHDLACKLITILGDGDQRRVALQHLLEAKDAAVRQRIDDCNSVRTGPQADTGPVKHG